MLRGRHDFVLWFYAKKDPIDGEHDEVLSKHTIIALCARDSVVFPISLLNKHVIVFSAAAKIKEAIIEREVVVYEHSSCQRRWMRGKAEIIWRSECSKKYLKHLPISAPNVARGHSWFDSMVLFIVIVCGRDSGKCGRYYWITFTSKEKIPSTIRTSHTLLSLRVEAFRALNYMRIFMILTLRQHRKWYENFWRISREHDDHGVGTTRHCRHQVQDARCQAHLCHRVCLLIITAFT